MDQHKEVTRRELKRDDLNPVSAMELIDTLQRLGISHHYEEEIDGRLGKLEEWDDNEHQDLRATSLRFRLLRQNAKPVSSDVFKKFMENGKFLKSLSHDQEGLLHLYEASYSGTGKEELLLEAMKFSETQLKLSLENKAQTNLSWRIHHALDLPSHLRMKRLESRLYIDVYRKQTSHNPQLLDLAKYDYNQVQLMYQRDLDEFSSWWKELGLVQKIGFGRDRPTEDLLWTVGIVPEPKYATARVELAKLIAIGSVIDDIFDTYGTMDDLPLFTAAVQRWNLDTLDQLPDYMKICYTALYNNTNEIAYKVLKEHGKNIQPYLVKAWIDMIESYMTEAEWFRNGFTPSCEDYIKNGVSSGGGYMFLVHAFFVLGKGLTTQNVQLMDKPYPRIFTEVGRILRLWDDVGTTEEEILRGDTSSCIGLLMKEMNMSGEDEAKEYVMRLIHDSWKVLNAELSGSSSLPLPVIQTCFNVARTSEVIYHHQEDSYFSCVDKFVDLILLKPIEN